MIPMALVFQTVGPALVAGPSWKLRPVGERQPDKNPNVMGVWYLPAENEMRPSPHPEIKTQNPESETEARPSRASPGGGLTSTISPE
jgi:hypothetical protein